MLTHLTIKNYALIRHLEMNPSPHLNVVTGETGAGKSIMLGAIGLLMGNRADKKVMWNEDEKCIIEGTFDIKAYRLKSLFRNLDLDYDDNTVIRREIAPGGKSRGFVNDTPVTLEVMRSVGSLLMDIHSQHETLQLGNHSFQLNLIDSFAGNAKLRDEYAEAWQRYLDAKKHFESLSEQATTLRNEAEYIRFQLDELLKAGLVENEQESLESELKVMEHAGEIKTRFNALLEILSSSEYSVQHNLAEARTQLQNVAAYSNAYENLLIRLESAKLELQDIADEIEKQEGKIEFDAERTEFVKERLSTLYKLLKKHRMNSVQELLQLQESLQQKATLTENLDDALGISRNNYENALGDLQKSAHQLSEARKNCFALLTKQIVKYLKELGIPNATLEVEHSHVPVNATGSDRVEILFSANKGITPRPLGDVASGGEFSRLMFSIKYVMAEKTSMPTLILDEVDNGVSGEIAIQLGKMMQAMSRKHQLITISHLPQIAAKGDSHYFVYKDNSEAKTVSNIKKLSENERVEEIAKMIGGAKPSKVALENAQELLSR